MEEANEITVRMIRIAVTGPESSGKTTLAESLADAYDCPLVGEYAREYLTGLNRPYTFEDVERIAAEQLKREQQTGAGELLICDTDVLVLQIWFEHKYGRMPDWLEETVPRKRYDHHLLTRPDIPYEPDPLRENPEKGDYFFELFRQSLEYHDFPYTIIEGSVDERMQKAKKAINTLIDGPLKID